MIHLAGQLDLDVIVEGIEDCGTEAAVVGLGGKFGQGYFYGKPLAAPRSVAAFAA